MSFHPFVWITLFFSSFNSIHSFGFIIVRHCCYSYIPFTMWTSHVDFVLISILLMLMLVWWFFLYSCRSSVCVYITIRSQPIYVWLISMNVFGVVIILLSLAVSAVWFHFKNAIEKQHTMDKEESQKNVKWFEWWKIRIYVFVDVRLLFLLLVLRVFFSISLFTLRSRWLRDECERSFTTMMICIFLALQRMDLTMNSK